MEDGLEGGNPEGGNELKGCRIKMRENNVLWDGWGRDWELFGDKIDRTWWFFPHGWEHSDF